VIRTIASGNWLTRERVSAVALISAIVGMAMLAVLFVDRHGTVDPFGQPVGSDFTAFWNAGRIANLGHAASAYDPRILNAAVKATHRVDYAMAWIYPPTFLFVASPLARLPYLAALLLWQTLSLAAVAAVLHAILGDWRALFVALASPITPMVLAGGQNSFLSAALLGSGLILLDRRPSTGGSVFGALTYKPQLGLAIAPLLLCRRNWRAITAAIVVAGVLAITSAMLWGKESWAAFPNGLANGRAWMEQGGAGFHKSASLFSLARLWGAAIPAAYGVQLLGLLFALFVIWRTARATPGMLNAGACAAVALATPYFMDYDTATVGLGASFFFAEGRQSGFLPYERSGLAFIWVAPWFSRPAAEFLRLPLGPFATLLLACLVLIRTARTASQPSGLSS